MSDNETQTVDSAETPKPKKTRGPRTMKQPPKSYFKDQLKQAQSLLAKNLVNLPSDDADEVQAFLDATGFKTEEPEATVEET